MTPHKDDIPITDYAFGQLDEEQRQAIEHALANDPDAQSELDSLLDTASQLEAEFASEFSQELGLDTHRKNKINRKLELLAGLHHRRRTRPAHWRWWIIFLPLALIAAILILILVLWYAFIG